MPLRNIRNLWSNSKQKSNSQADSEGTRNEESKPSGPLLPLLQIWPSEDPSGKSELLTLQQFDLDSDNNTNIVHLHDSGIDSVQASPSHSSDQNCQHQQQSTYEFPEITSNKNRRTSCSFLHPDHARLIKTAPKVSEHVTEAVTDSSIICSGSSSTASSMNSIAGGIPQITARHSDPWDHRRCSVMTRCSLFDSIDLEYALLRAAARSSVGQHSLSQSIHKLTFTQSLAFPALAKGLAVKHRGTRVSSAMHTRAIENSPSALARVITAVALFLVSLMVFGIVFKYVNT